MEQLTLLLIEDDARLAQFTVQYLERYEVKVTHVADGERGLREALRARYDAVLLDLMLPIKDGLSVCREIRGHSDVPILMVTARGEEVDRVLGLELGADDYLPKPFSPRELLARVRAVVRRRRGLAGPAQLIQVRSVDVRISRLRQKFGEEAGKTSLIRTVRGLGYMIAAESDQ